MSQLVVFVAAVYDPYLYRIFVNFHRYQRVVIPDSSRNIIGKEGIFKE